MVCVHTVRRVQSPSTTAHSRRPAINAYIILVEMPNRKMIVTHSLVREMLTKVWSKFLKVESMVQDDPGTGGFLNKITF